MDVLVTEIIGLMKQAGPFAVVLLLLLGAVKLLNDERKEALRLLYEERKTNAEKNFEMLRQSLAAHAESTAAIRTLTDVITSKRR